MVRVVIRFLILIICIVCSFGVANIYENIECNLRPELIFEIESYKSIADRIMHEINNTLGVTMYNEYTKCIDEFGARPSGSRILERSIDYMINLTLSNGLKTISTEDVWVPNWIRGSETAVMLQPRFKQIAILGFGASVSTPLEGITAEVIVIDSFDELNELDANLIKGKIVVFDVQYTSYSETVHYRVEGASRASRKGAVATLIRSVTSFSLYTLHTGAQAYDKDVIKIPTAAVTHEDADLLRRLQNQGQTIVIKIIMFSSMSLGTSRNTMIDLVGRENPAKLVIVSGHIDSWDVGQGAIDNGCGMFVSWYVPVVLNKLKLRPRRTLRAILWTAEEPGLVGAASYLQRHMSELSNINFIMESDKGTFKPLGLDVSGSINAVCVIGEILKLFTPINKMKVSETVGSDITIFNRKGVPGASLLNENDHYFWYHHTEADTLNVQNKNDLIECAAFWAAISYVISDLSIDIPRYSFSKYISYKEIINRK